MDVRILKKIKIKDAFPMDGFIFVGYGISLMLSLIQYGALEGSSGKVAPKKKTDKPSLCGFIGLFDRIYFIAYSRRSPKDHQQGLFKVQL